MNKKKAFTLIELLIVVAIIGILAAIAVPNFLNARMKAQVTRSISEIKAISTAMEMYRIDNNSVPFRPPGWPCGNCDIEELTATYNPSPITSPVAYMTSIPYDPFVSVSEIKTNVNRGDGLDIGWYLYVGNRNSENPHGAWRVWGFGPDKSRQAQPVRPYNSTNGLISKGDIIANEKYGFLTEDIGHLFGISKSTDNDTIRAD